MALHRTQRAARGAALKTPSGLDSTSAKRWAKGRDFTGPGPEARGADPKKAPAAVREAFALWRTWEQNDEGSTRLLAATVDGKKLYALHASTDGDDGFLEL